MCMSVAYCQADKMLGLVALHADIGVDEQYESGLYHCRFSEAVSLTTSSPRQYINKKCNCWCRNASSYKIQWRIQNAAFSDIL